MDKDEVRKRLELFGIADDDGTHENRQKFAALMELMGAFLIWVDNNDAMPSLYHPDRQGAVEEIAQEWLVG
jgi:hypothetical protein